MKRIIKLIFSCIACVTLIITLSFGVYAVMQPSITITGTVSYDVGSAKVHITGSISGAYNSDLQTLVNSPYDDYTNNDDKTNLKNWNINNGSVFYFKQTSGGDVTPITITLTIENNSVYPISGVIEDEAETTKSNVTKVISYSGTDSSSLNIGVGETKSLTVTYSVTNLMKSANINISNMLKIERQ